MPTTTDKLVICMPRKYLLVHMYGVLKVSTVHEKSACMSLDFFYPLVQF